MTSGTGTRDWSCSRAPDSAPHFYAGRRSTPLNKNVGMSVRPAQSASWWLSTSCYATSSTFTSWRPG